MKTVTTDGNGAACYISYAFCELALIYPITPSSPMAELADEWSATGKTNLFGKVPTVKQLQSEAGAAGALHGALSCGALATTYTCSQGLLLMQPNMFKIAGELLPTVFHVSARALATHALSIFGDHQDVMACRQTGFAMLCASSVQEVADMALVAHLSTLKSQIPFLHFFDGFRTSHEVNKICLPEYEEIKPLVDEEDIARFRARALSPNAPVQRGTAQNPDVYFQNRETANARYFALPSTVQEIMEKVGALTGRKYRAFDYFGAEDATRVLVVMGSATSTAEETVEALNASGEKTGLIKVRLYRPFDGKAFCDALPASCEKIAVLDRTKEAGALGEPLYLDICTALKENGKEKIITVGGRYGLGQKEFTPADCRAVFENLLLDEPKNHFTVGILDDITNLSLPVTPFSIPKKDALSCIFYGLGSDGTVGANKNSIQLIGDETELFVQGYFCYDSRKSGGVTVSHLRISKTPVRSAYLVQNARFIACHNPSYLNRYDMLEKLQEGGVFLLNTPYTKIDELNACLPPSFIKTLQEKKAKLFVIDGTGIAAKVGLKGRTGTVMQTAFFYLHPEIMPYEKAVERLKSALAKKFARKGERVVESNLKAIDLVEGAIRKIEVTALHGERQNFGVTLPNDDYFRNFIQPILSLRGDKLPVSAFQEDGSVPTATTRLEKHGAPPYLPKWIPENCIQCNQCSFVCPHACIRPFLTEKDEKVPPAFVTIPAVGIPEKGFRVQVSLHDCMGCGVCANTCPAKEKALVMRPVDEFANEGENWAYASAKKQAGGLPFKRDSVKGSQFFKPLFEFSYACSGCGETPYIKLLTQLFGEKMIIANATGCSSIYGGSCPTCPYTVNDEGKGPAWANSLFEDNAEFGLGFRLACEARDKKDSSVWLIGGDGWAYDIGFGGLDHALASGANINALVLDSEVYSNTGGQSSKATPLGAVARFATAGKRTKKKNLALMAMTYGYVYVAQVSMGADKNQLIKALTEAEAYDGPSLIIAYSPCIAHGVNMGESMNEEKRAVDSGYWNLFRFNPALQAQGKNPFILDSKAPSLDLKSFLTGENRFASLFRSQPKLAEELLAQAEEENARRFAFYQKLAGQV